MLLSAHQVANTTDKQEMIDGILRRSPQFRKLDVLRNVEDLRYRFNRATIGSVRIGMTSASSVRYTADAAQDVALAMIFAGRETMTCGAETRHLLPVPAFLPGSAALGVVEDARFLTIRMASARLREHLAAEGWRGNLEQWLERSWLTRLPGCEAVGSCLGYVVSRIDRHGLPGPAEARVLEDLIYVHSAQLIMGDSGDRAMRHDNRSFRRCVDYIDRYLDGPVSVLDLAEAAGMSVRSVQLLFQRHAGMDISNFVLKRRLLRARDALLMADGQQTIQELALACGFNTLSHFNRAYRAAFGETPRETRRLRR